VNFEPNSWSITRRDFLKTTALGTAAIMTGSALPLPAARKQIPIGVQLYSVRSTAQADLPGTLTGLKQIGYDGVEFAGYFNLEATKLRQLLDDNGLYAFGSHLLLNNFNKRRIDSTIEYAAILGIKYLTVPMIFRANTRKAWEKAADDFSEIAEKLKPHGMQIGLHNHTGEFKTIDGTTRLELFFNRASEDVFMQLDIGHCIKVADPLVYLNMFPGRARSVHIKDWNPDTQSNIIGEGDVPWPEILTACETVGGTEIYIIEEESGTFEGLEGVEKMLQGVNRFLDT